MEASARRPHAQNVSQEGLMPQEAPPTRTPGLPYLSPPPAPGNGLALLRWTITVLKASTGRNRAAIRRHHAPTGGTESLGTVAIAIGADLAMFIAKAVAAALTGSAALFAETLHSLADTGNQLLLLKGLRGTRRGPTPATPSGTAPSCSTGHSWPRSASSLSAASCRSGRARSACSTPARCS
jgi:hypothetical protein